MGLREVQSALARMVTDHGAGARPAHETLAALEPGVLDAAERAWLEKVAASPGFALTAFIQRWWREARLRTGASLTLAVLGEEREPLVREYLRGRPCASLFNAAEAVAFLEYVEEAAQGPHLRAVAAFERAVWTSKRLGDTVRQAPPAPEEWIVASPAASIVTFEAPAEAVLGALLTGRPLPAPGPARWPLLVSPGLPRLGRPATQEEARVFEACRTPVRAGEVAGAPGVIPEAVGTLWADGALCRPPGDGGQSP